MRLQRCWRRRSIPATLLISTLLTSAMAASTTDTDTDTAAATSTSDSTTAATTTGTTAAASTTGTDASTSTTLPSLTGSSASGSSTSGSLPTISSTSSTSSTIVYPTQTVPPTANAPYMQKSNLPEGTVFIGVGAGLAFIAVMMIAWRLIVAWTVNRSVKKAAMAQYTHDSKTFEKQRRKSDFYSQSPESTMSLEKLSKNGRNISQNLSKSQPPNASLFFSPTAGAGMQSISNRTSSGYLPAGYYSVGNASAGNGMPTTQLGAGNTNTKRPSSSHYNHVPGGAYEDSPQTSPEFNPSSGRYHRGHGPMDSTSSLTAAVGSNSQLRTNSSVSNLPATRTPSTYLDDLMSIPPLPPPRGGEYGKGGSDPSRRNQF